MSLGRIVRQLARLAARLDRLEVRITSLEEFSIHVRLSRLNACRARRLMWVQEAAKKPPGVSVRGMSWESLVSLLTFLPPAMTTTAVPLAEWDHAGDASRMLRELYPAACPPAGLHVKWSDERHTFTGTLGENGWWRQIWHKAQRQFPNAYIQVVDAGVMDEWTMRCDEYCWATFRVAQKLVPDN